MQTDAHPSMEQCRSHTVTLTLIITHQPDATALTAQIKGWRRMGPAGSLSGKIYIVSFMPEDRKRENNMKSCRTISGVNQAEHLEELFLKLLLCSRSTEDVQSSCFMTRDCSLHWLSNKCCLRWYRSECGALISYTVHKQALKRDWCKLLQFIAWFLLKIFSQNYYHSFKNNQMSNPSSKS